MILVTGSTGASGSAVVREFARRGLAVRALARHVPRRTEIEGLSTVEVVRGDMAEPDTLGAALEGVRKVLMISSANESLTRTQCAFIDAAQRAGVRHIVKFSGCGCWPESAFRFARMHARVEQHLRRSGLGWTMLRPSQFMHVYFREAPTIVRDGVLAMPMARARLAPVDVADIAKIAVEVLRGEGHEGRRYEITGPEALTMDEVAETISAAIGLPVRYADVDPEAKHRALLESGIPSYFADAMDELFAERRKNLDESRVDLSTHARFGVSPTTLFAFARRHAAVLRGEAAPHHLWASGWQPSV
ncbi:MAG: SDR family oxidoreductase [Pseudonocardia sp.]|nr:SDR family oxidoreductase [Pseudonocardia sp.]